MNLVDDIKDCLSFFDRHNIVYSEDKNLELGISYFSSEDNDLVLGLADFNKKTPDYYEVIFYKNRFEIFKREGSNKKTDSFFSNYGTFIINKIKEYEKTKECRTIIRTIEDKLC